MRADPGDFDLLAPGSLRAVVALLAAEPGVWLPIAGGTDVMVLYGAGSLSSRKLVSIWNLPELRGIEETAGEISIGAACTYTNLREHSGVAREFPLLARAASWTGGIANQNRGTLGGNIVNASPAADCLPPLLVYDAELTLTSIRGERRVPYRGFHLGYKKTVMAADELIRAIHLKKKFAKHFSYARKVGARQAQAIAKVSIAALGRVAAGGVIGGVTGGVIEDARIALGSVAPVPLRLDGVERALIGQNLRQLSENDLRQQVKAEIAPISDIRSTADYRAAVACNLVLEFFTRLRDETKIAEKLAQWNSLSREDATTNIFPCCGSRAWAEAMAARRPFADGSDLLATAREVWRNLAVTDWLEAFRSHPRIGELPAPRPPSALSSSSSVSQAWSAREQRQVAESDESVKSALAEGNRRYEERFNRIFIVCATGKSPREILHELQRRLHNDEASELREAAAEQEKIIQIRLRKWLEG